MKQRLQLAAWALGAALMFGAGGTVALAAGSGGGGASMPAPSGPSINPAEEYRLGIAALQAQNYSQAVQHLRAVLRVSPNDTNTNYVYAIALIGNDDARAARRPLERATRDNAAPADAWVQLGRVYLQTSEPAKAQEQLDDLNAMIAACAAPACTEARRTELTAAKTQLEQAIAQGAAAAPTTGWLPPGEGAARAAYAEAVGYINEERYADALGALQRASAAAGPNPDILNYMGFANRKLGHYDVAIGYYGQALLIDPHHVGANEYLGELYIETGRFEDARRQLAVLDRLCPYGCAEREELARWLTAAND